MGGVTEQTPIFHITEPALWQEASERGSYDRSTRSASLADVGYVHCSYADQVETVANALYADWSDALVLLEIDVAQVGSPIRVENLEGGTQEFPHIYGPIPAAAVHRTHRLDRSYGRWRLPDLPTSPR
jgi:uncharacterized protein (DUF952 family)